MHMLASFDWNRFMSGPDVPIVLVISMTLGALVVSMLAIQWRRVRIAEAEISLKARMVERGFTPAQIEQVLAKPTPRASRKHRRDESFVMNGHTCCG